MQNTSTGLLDAMNNFKRACSRAGVTGSAKASLEECIDGIKQLIRTADDEDGLEVRHCFFFFVANVVVVYFFSFLNAKHKLQSLIFWFAYSSRSSS